MMRWTRRCVSRGKLRAYLDAELEPQQQAEIDEHLVSCERCRAQLSRLQRTACVTRERLNVLSIGHAEPNVSEALANVRSLGQAKGILTGGRIGIMNRRGWRAVASSVVVLAVLVGVFSFAPSRALARQFLSIFRVRKFAVVQINPDRASLEEAGRVLQETLFFEDPEVVVDEPVIPADSSEEARQIAGFDVRVPRALDPAQLRYEVKGRTELRLPLRRESLVAFLELAGLDASSVPADWEEGEVRAMAPAMVHIQAENLEIVQVWEPTIEYPEGVNPRLVGEAGLILIGLSPKDARDISSRVDWTSTVLLPIPANIARFQETRVAGEEAVLLESAESTDKPFLLFWERDGVLYLVSGRHPLESLVQVAESMF